MKQTLGSLLSFFDTIPKVTLWLGLLVICNSCDSRRTKGVYPYSNPNYDSISIHLEKSKNTQVSAKQKLEYVQKASKFIETLKDDSIKIKAYVEVGRNFYRIGELESFYANSLRMDTLSRTLGDSTGMARVMYNLGDYYYRKEKTDSAYLYYFRAERLYAQLKNPLDAGKAVLSMAIIQKNVGDYIGGEASSIKAINYFEPIDEVRFLASAYNNLGILSKELGKYDQAIEYHTKALKSRKELKNNNLVVGSLNNIGLVYASKKEYPEAMRYYEMALDHDSIMRRKPKTWARVLDNVAHAKFLSGDYSSLPELFERPLKMRDSLKDNLGAVTSNLNLAEFYLKIDSLSRAYQYAKVAFEKSEPLQYHRGELEALAILGETAPLSEAIHYANTRIRISDSLQIAERRFREQFARVRYETDVLETEKDQVTRRNKWLTIILLGSLTAFLSIYIFIQRRANKRDILFRESQQKANEDIYNLLLSQQLKLEEGKQLEKQRISEELHDGVLGKLFGTRLSLDSLNRKHDEKVIADRARHIDELKRIEEEIRQISHDLNTNVFGQDLLFVDAIENLIETQCKADTSSTLNFEFTNDYEINWEEMPNAVKVHLYRIVQEALHNVQKHAKASKVRIWFTKGKSQITLFIEDNGIGMMLNKTRKGIGLKNIASRVKQIKGVMKITSEKGKGTILSVKTNI